MLQPNYKAFVVLFILAGATGYVVWPKAPAPAANDLARPAPVTAAIEAADASFQQVDFADAIAGGEIVADISGNGRDAMRITLTNPKTQPHRVILTAGTIFRSGSNHVVLTRDDAIAVSPGAAVKTAVRTAAVSSANAVTEGAYELRAMRMPQLEPLIAYLRAHPELSDGAAQTAVLALTENLPASAFASYDTLDGDLPSQFDTSAFRVPTSEIIQALVVLRAIGVSEDQLALTVDPQLKIEAMIDPLAHALAMRYYGITAQQEWEYWKTELLRGDASTRHYALYGIARFFPDVAIEMLPQWARAAKTSPVYRMSAVRALAETQRAEALPVLRQLAYELGADTDLGRSAHEAAEVLDKKINHSEKLAVNFRASPSVAQLPELPSAF